jgi:hypothetical protein
MGPMVGALNHHMIGTSSRFIRTRMPIFLGAETRADINSLIERNNWHDWMHTN